jgi:hypothetical protein
MYRQSLERHQRALGKEHPNSLNNEYWLADVLAKQQKWEGAETIFRRVLEADKRILGREHKKVRSDYRQLAFVLRGQQRYDEAEAICST